MSTDNRAGNQETVADACAKVLIDLLAGNWHILCGGRAEAARLTRFLEASLARSAGTPTEGE